jgi:hypothetical protein
MIGSIRRRGARPGTAAVELAVMLPLLFFIFFVAVDFGRILYHAITIDNCCHNGGLFGSQTFDNEGQQWVPGAPQYWQGPSGQMVSTEQVATDVDGKNLGPPLAASNVTVTNGTDANGNPVNNVSVTYTFYTVMNYPGIGNAFTLQRTYQARVAPGQPN